MKILVADDDSVCRTVLSTLLEKAHHEAVPFADGAAALAALLAPEGPPIAILDWMMPGLDGLEVCAKLRASNLKLRPYVIMQSARREKTDIVAGLDSGADDYLPKPVNGAELLARLRVAERTITHQRELKHQIDEMELMIQRYNLLGEMVVRPTSQTNTAVADNNQPAQVGFPVEFTDQNVQTIVAQTFKELGLGETRAKLVIQPGPYQTAAFTAWAGIILPRENIWMDLLLESTADDIEKLCKKSLHRSGRGKEVPGVLAETQTILSAALKADILARGSEVMTPLLSRVRPTQNPDQPIPSIPNRRSHVFTFGDCTIGLTLTASQCRLQRKDAKQLQPLDILASPVFMPGMSGVPLFTEGAILNARHIERLTAMASEGENGLLVSVFELSEIAQYFYR